MAYRNKTYVCFDADSDIRYYNMMKAWKENAAVAFNFHNAHELNSLMVWSNEQTIKRRLRERMDNTKVLIVLVGEKTKYLYKFVRWEISIALERDIPIICCNLNKTNGIDSDRCPAVLREELAVHVPYGQRPIDHALNNWPDHHRSYRKDKKSGPYFFGMFDQ